jgi:hypothetical protein
MEEIEKEIQSRLKVDAEFIKLLVEALMTPAPVSTQRDANAWYNEYICRKHGHQGWCERMHALFRYTRLAINYHHAKKGRWDDNSEKYMGMVRFYGDLKAEARLVYYRTACTCFGLSNNNQFEPVKPDNT